MTNMAGKAKSAEQLRAELRQVLELFLEHNSTSGSTVNDGFITLSAVTAHSSTSSAVTVKRARPINLTKMVQEDRDVAGNRLDYLYANIGMRPQGSIQSSFSLDSSAVSAGAPAAQAYLPIFKCQAGSSTLEKEGEKHEMDDTFETVAKELDVIACAINEQYSPELKQGSSSAFFAVVSNLVSGTMATFGAAFSQWLPAELPEVQQLALLYHVARVAVQRVSDDSDKTRHITDLTVDYACEQYGGYILASGGLETVVVKKT